MSVIVPIFNAEKWIARTLQSVIEQTYKDWECLLINDGSTDNSGLLLSNIVRQNPERAFKILTIPNSGVSNARNMGIEAARGEFIALLDSDDIWMADKLEQQLKFLTQNEDFSAVLCDFFISESPPIGTTRKSRLITQKRMSSLGKDWLSMEGNGALLSSTLLFKKTPATLDLRFDTDLNTMADLDFFLNLESVVRVGRVNSALAEYCQHDGQMHLNPDTLKREYRILLDNLKKLPMSRARLESNVLMMSALLNFRVRALGKGIEDVRRAIRIRPLSLLTLPSYVLLKRIRSFYSRVMRGIA